MRNGATRFGRGRPQRKSKRQCNYTYMCVCSCVSVSGIQLQVARGRRGAPRFWLDLNNSNKQIMALNLTESNKLNENIIDFIHGVVLM